MRRRLMQTNLCALLCYIQLGHCCIVHWSKVRFIKEGPTRGPFEINFSESGKIVWLSAAFWFMVQRRWCLSAAVETPVKIVLESRFAVGTVVEASR